VIASIAPGWRRDNTQEHARGGHTSSRQQHVTDPGSAVHRCVDNPMASASGSATIKVFKKGARGAFGRDEWEEEVASDTPNLKLAKGTALEPLRRARRRQARRRGRASDAWMKGRQR
jgi:hypothetical protein